MFSREKFLAAEKGHASMFLALSAPVLILAAGGTIDFANFSAKRDGTQQSLDVAALGAAQILFENATADTAKKEQRVRAYVAQSLQKSGLKLAPDDSVLVNQQETSVAIKMKFEVPAAFLKLAGLPNFKTQVSTKAAVSVEEQPVCILALASGQTTGIKFSGKGTMKAKDCVVWSNANGPQSIVFDGNGKVSASKICAVGRATSPSVYTVAPTPESNCRPIVDPFAEWTPPAAQPCTVTSSDWIDRITAQLEPGVYCGGLRVNAKNIFMSPGVYVIRDGPLILRGESKITGKGVGIWLEGADTKMEIDGRSSVSLQSATTGPLAGIVIASSALEAKQDSTVTGRADLKIGGVIYLPNHNLTYWGESDTRAASPVTTIIANTIDIGGDAYLEVKNDKSKAKYAPVVTTGAGSARLVQ